MVKIVQVVQVSRWSAFMICIQKIVCVSFVVWHPDITNPFEYGKLFHNKSFPNIARIANAVQVTICLLVSTSVY